MDRCRENLVPPPKPNCAAVAAASRPPEFRDQHPIYQRRIWRVCCNLNNTRSQAMLCIQLEDSYRVTARGRPYLNCILASGCVDVGIVRVHRAREKVLVCQIGEYSYMIATTRSPFYCWISFPPKSPSCIASLFPSLLTAPCRSTGIIVDLLVHTSKTYSY